MMLDRFFSWMSDEPTIGLLMMAVTLVLFIRALRRDTEESRSLWPWLRRIIEAGLSALLFLGMLWAFRSILTTNTGTFFATHGSLSDTSLESAQSIWGKPHV